MEQCKIYIFTKAVDMLNLIRVSKILPTVSLPWPPLGRQPLLLQQCLTWGNAKRPDLAKGVIPDIVQKINQKVTDEKEQKRNFLDFNDVTLVVVDKESERFVKSTCLQQDLFDMTMVTIMFDTKTSESESFIDRSIEGIINIMMEFHHF